MPDKGNHDGEVQGRLPSGTRLSKLWFSGNNYEFATHRVRIYLYPVPDGVSLRAGTTASVLVITGSAKKTSNTPVVAAPDALH